MRLYYGTYGHHLSGKLYVYWGDDNYRTGQQVVAPVTNKKSGKTYNTMFTIARAQSETSKGAESEVARLGDAGINIKTLGSRDLLSLPGGAGFETKKEWAERSEAYYRKKHGLTPLIKGATAPKQPKPKSTQSRQKPPKNDKSAQLSKLSRLRHISTVGIRDDAVERAKAALRNSKTASDSFKQKDRLKRMK